MRPSKEESYTEGQRMGDHSLFTSGTNISLNCGLQVSVHKKTFKVLPAEGTQLLHKTFSTISPNAAAFMCPETLLLNISWGKIYPTPTF